MAQKMKGICNEYFCFPGTPYISAKYFFSQYIPTQLKNVLPTKMGDGRKNRKAFLTHTLIHHEKDLEKSTISESTLENYPDFSLLLDWVPEPCCVTVHAMGPISIPFCYCCYYYYFIKIYCHLVTPWGRECWSARQGLESPGLEG